jgi:hypothetical protein
MHVAFDELTGVVTPERGLWDAHIKHLRVPGTVKNHSMQTSSAYGGADISVADMITWSGVAKLTQTQTTLNYDLNYEVPTLLGEGG